jgi:hypothetical protein
LQALREDAHEALALLLVVHARIEGIDIARQAALAPHVVEHVFVGREDVLAVHLQALRHAVQEVAGDDLVGDVGLGLVTDQAGFIQIGSPSRASSN